jgi:TatD DNase family protein
MYFDSHTHVNDKAFADDQDAVIKRALDAQTWMINVGTDLANSRLAVDLSKKYPTGVFVAIGLHPTETENFDEANYTPLLSSNRVMAVGECGLDYFRLPPDGQEGAVKMQKTEFIKQLVFAQKHGLPVIIHCRDAYVDLIEILKSEYAGGGVAHSFTDTWDTAKKFLDLGFYIALNGILTFDKTGRLSEVVEKTPFDRLLIETDAPYLAPPPYRGKRNEPSYVRHVAEKIAEIKKMDMEEAGQQTFENACKLFGIKKPVS